KAEIREAVTDCELRNFLKRLVRFEPQSIAETGKLLLVNQPDGQIVPEYPCIFGTWKFEHVIADVQIPAFQGFRLHDVFPRALAALDCDEILTGLLFHLFASSGILVRA